MVERRSIRNIRHLVVSRAIAGIGSAWIALLPTYSTDAAPPVEADFYAITDVPGPEDIPFEVSGMDFLPDARLAIAIRRGEVWILENPSSAPPVFKKFAAGLHEPLGLAHHDGDLFVTQRTELTRLRDTNGDGTADEYLAFAKGWGVSGNYHEYAYGPVVDPEGRFWITLNCTIGRGPRPDDRDWRGWSLRIDPDGSWAPVSAGFRSPCGLGLNAEGDLFVTDQQGNWFGTCALLHVREGTFHGHADALEFTDRPGSPVPDPGDLPTGITVVEAARRIPGYTLPAVWFPYRTMGMSATDVLSLRDDERFGPFGGQMLVGEFTMSRIHRVFLEEVDGVFQGACFRFREGFPSAVFRLAQAPNGDVWVGETNRGWNSLGGRAWGLQRLQWSGRTPFEIREMRTRPDGFELSFTLPVDPDTIRPSAFEMTSHTYDYHAAYGSDEVDARGLRITHADVSDDHATVRLRCDGLRAGYVHTLRVDQVRSAEGLPLLHDVACYTLNRIPRAPGEP